MIFEGKMGVWVVRKKGRGKKGTRESCESEDVQESFMGILKDC